MQQSHQTPSRQILVRLPDDIAARLARAVAPRQRNRFVVDLLRRELEKEDAALIAACEAMNRFEAIHPESVQETQQWLEADLVRAADDWDPDFDAEKFSRDAAVAQAALASVAPPAIIGNEVIAPAR